MRNDTREFTLLDGMWKIQFDPEVLGEKNEWQNGLPDAFSMPVPASFADLFTEKEKREYCGDFWYETKFFLDEDNSTRVILRFSGVTHRADVYINGVKAGSHEGGFTPFALDISDLVNSKHHLFVFLKKNIVENGCSNWECF